MYLTQPTFREILNFDIFFAKKVFRIKTAITFAQNLASQNSEGKYESRKILDFARKNEKKCFL
jgi:hypothetical protein